MAILCGHIISSSSQPGWGWVPAGPQSHLGPFPPQAVIPCPSASAALHPGTGSDTTGSSALTMAGCTSHHASPSPHSRHWWTITLVWPFPASVRVDGTVGSWGSRQCALTILLLLKNIQTDGRGATPIFMPVPVPRNTGWEPSSPHVLTAQTSCVSAGHSLTHCCGSEAKPPVAGTVLSQETRPRAIAVVEFS